VISIPQAAISLFSQKNDRTAKAGEKLNNMPKQNLMSLCKCGLCRGAKHQGYAIVIPALQLDLRQHGI
jgi:hypothetical protein